MRGRTNISSGGGAVVNGDIQNYEVAPNNIIGAGDFVQLQYESNYKHIFPNNTSKACIKIPFTNKYILAFQLGDNSAYGVGMYEFKNNILESVSEIITTNILKLNEIILLDNDYAAISGSTNSTADYFNLITTIKINTTDNTLIISKNNGVGHNYFTLFNNKIYLIYKQFSKYAIYDCFEYSISEGVLTQTKKSEVSFNRYSNSIKGYVKINENIIGIAYESRATATAGEYSYVIQQIILPESTNDVFSSGKSIVIDSNYTQKSVFVGVFHFSDDYFGVYDYNGVITVYDRNFLKITTANYSYDAFLYHRFVNIQRDVVLLVANSKVIRIEFDQTIKKINLSNSFVMDGFSQDYNTPAAVILKDNIYMLILNDGYYCLSYVNDILQEGYPGLTTKVKQYENYIEGFAKTGGSSGETIQVYVPSGK